jgi:hypothetical protein
LDIVSVNSYDRRLMLTMHQPKRKGKAPLPPEPGKPLKNKKKIWFFGNRPGFELKREDGIVWIYDGSTPFWVHESQVSDMPPSRAFHRPTERH